MKTCLLFVLLSSLTFSLSSQTYGELIPAFGAQKTLTINVDQLVSLLKLGVARKDSLIVIFHQVVLYLESTGQRVLIPGDVYRLAAKEFFLGGERIEAIIPSNKILSMAFGAVQEPSQNSVDIHLNAPHSQYLERADFSLEKHYGFKKISPEAFLETFGVKVIQFYWGFDVNRIELENQETSHNNIAIHIDGIPRPKRWTIQQIREPPRSN